MYKSLYGSDEEVHNVSLRECHVILFMDNLVRLTVHEDPDPGCARTSQICTLPITLKGLPCDCYITNEWHDENCQRSSNNECSCMEKEQLQKDDLNLLI